MLNYQRVLYKHVLTMAHMAIFLVEIFKPQLWDNMEIQAMNWIMYCWYCPSKMMDMGERIHFFFALDLLEIEEIHGTWGSVLPSGPSDHEADGVGGKRHRQVLTLCSNHVQRQKPDSFYVLKNHQAGSIITTSLRPIPGIMVSKGNHPQMALIQMSEI